MNAHLPNNARYELAAPLPDHWWCGEPLSLPIAITNTGTTVWGAPDTPPVSLSYHWRTYDGHTVVHDGLRTPLPTILPPGATATIEMRIKAPPEPGRYQLVVDLIQEGVFWFSDRGVVPLVLLISYQAGPAPRISIICRACLFGDVVGEHIVAQMHTLASVGYPTLLLAEHLDSRLPADIRRAAVALTLPDLTHPARRSHRVAEHFFSSDIIIVHADGPYDLAESATLLRHAVLILDDHTHGESPPYSAAFLRAIDYILAHTPAAATRLREHSILPPQHVLHIPYQFVPRALPCTGPPQSPASDRPPTLLYSGPLSEDAHLCDLVDALSHIHKHHPGAQLLLVGEASPEEQQTTLVRARERARANGCSDHVTIHIIGETTPPETTIPPADLFITAWREHRIIPSLVRAMACGMPVIAPRTPLNRDLIGDGGMFYNPGATEELAAHALHLLTERAKRPSSPTSNDVAALPPGPIVFVVPRYGRDVVGGAERLIRGWAEQLAQCGHPVEVLTTTTIRIDDWSNRPVPPYEEIDGVIVRRFPIDQVDRRPFDEVHTKARQGYRVSYDDEQDLLRHNFQSSALNHHLRQHRERIACAIFAPYLFGTTVLSMRELPEKAIIVPCLHDEPLAYLHVYREMLESAAAILFNTQSECDFATEVLHIRNPNRAIVGYGFDINTPPGDGAAFRARHKLPERIVLYSGRIEGSKNIPLLLDAFQRYQAIHPGDAMLVLTGIIVGEQSIPDRDDIRYLGMLPESELPDAFAAASVVCQPSLTESFSIVLMEAWLQKRPVLVHAACDVTRLHVEESGGGDVFADVESFCVALHRLLHDAEYAKRAGERGHAFVAERYRWEIVINRLTHAIATFLSRPNDYDDIAQRAIRHALHHSEVQFGHAMLQVLLQARQTKSGPLSRTVQELTTLPDITMPDYTITSSAPLVGPLIAWMRRHLTSHLKEPYLDRIIDRQTAFNRTLLQTIIPLLAHNLQEQRRLRRDLTRLQEQMRRERRDE